MCQPLFQELGTKCEKDKALAVSGLTFLLVGATVIFEKVT
jgi:hypothetical protein